MMKSKRNGFTLVELLVVIAIIGLLASIVFLSLNHARSKARDAKRVSEIREIADALELYYSDQAIPAYPVVTSANDIGDNDPNDNVAVVNDTLINSVYLASVPSAPFPHDDPAGSSDCSNNGASGWVGDSYRYQATAGESSAAACGSGATCGSWYRLSFCLGSATGDVTAGCNQVTPTGIVPGNCL